MPNLTIFAFLGLLVRGVRTHYLQKLKILVFGRKSKVRGVSDLALHDDFSPNLSFPKFYRSDLKIRGDSNPPPPEIKIHAFGKKSKVRGVSDLASRTDFSPCLSFSDFCHSDLEIRGEVRTHHLQR